MDMNVRKMSEMVKNREAWKARSEERRVGKECGQEKGMKEDKMVGWHH